MVLSISPAVDVSCGALALVWYGRCACSVGGLHTESDRICISNDPSVFPDSNYGWKRLGAVCAMRGSNSSCCSRNCSLEMRLMADSRVFLGGVPFGADNVGDEAILECIVETVRQIRPDCALTVSTNSGPLTAQKLHVRTCPLYGFLPEHPYDGFSREIQNHGTFIWSGATGLSDYPEVPLRLLDIAQRNARRRLYGRSG